MPYILDMKNVKKLHFENLLNDLKNFEASHFSYLRKLFALKVYLSFSTFYSLTIECMD